VLQQRTRGVDDASKSAGALFSELQAIKMLYRISEICASPTLKANAKALKARTKKLESELSSRRRKLQ
jgi:hypothetical protein